MTVYVKDTRTGYQQAIVSVAGAIAAHEAAADPHPTYLTSAEGSASFSPIGHNHDASYAAIGHTHTQLHDAATVSDSDTLDLTITGQAISGSVKKQMSIDSDASGLKLSGDSASPGNTKLYGTNSSGVKGWYDQPSGGGGGGGATVTDCIVYSIALGG